MKRIAYWLDTTSGGADQARWIVSLEDGDASQTLHVMPADATEPMARQYALREGRERQLPVTRD